MNNYSIEEINRLFKEACGNLKVSSYVQAVAKIIFHKAASTISDVDKMVLASTCIYISCKISDLFYEPSEFINVVGYPISIEAEMRILKIIDFNFKYFDIYHFVESTCRTLKMDIRKKIQKLDEIFSDMRINNVSFLGNTYEIKNVCMAVFEQEEIELFERIYCIEVDYEKVNEAKKGLLY